MKYFVQASALIGILLLHATSYADVKSTAFEDYIKNVSTPVHVAQVCNMGCYGRFSSDQDIVCNAQALQECVELTYCVWTCK